MKKILFIIFCILASLAQAQQVPTGIGSQSISQYCSRTGNQSTGSTPTSANIFGTAWNSPIYTITDGVVRTKLNGTLNQPINGVSQNVTGFFGIGRDAFFNTNTPASLLHLAGTGSTTTIAGWRPWMQSGTFIQEFSDAMYVGMQFQNSNRIDAIINWSDDQSGSGGPDKLKFVFTGAKLNNNINVNPLDGLSTFGYEFMQLTSFPDIINSAGFPVGHVGIGPTFTNVLPQSRLHINSEDNIETWLQISNQTGTGQTQTDGFRLGITSNGIVNFRQQENQPIIFYSDWDGTTGGVTSGERLRITTTNAFGVPNPNNLNNNTRVAISIDGNNPITEPRSLLHLGKNTGTNSYPLGSNDGWRSWMDLGVFNSNGTDHIFLGLKNQGQPDLNDAVLNWGDNQSTPNVNEGPDNLLFVFTATQTGLSSPPGNSQNGVESMRMSPTITGVNVGIGGNPNTNYYFNNSVNPTQTLEVNSPATAVGATNSGLRFTDLNSNTTPIANNPNAGF